MDLDIEREIENIPNEQTRKQFTSVYQLYAIGNYRACIVMLWSCIICDLLTKLESSIVLNDDSIARSIVSEVNGKRTGEQMRADWESDFINLLKCRTKFFSDISYKQIQEIHQHRHWCAHPTFNDNYDLYSPSKDLCRDHMCRALQNVFLRPPFMTKHLTEVLLNSLSMLRKYNYDETIVGRYLEEKYLKGLPLDLENRLFRDMWHIVFFTESDNEAVLNRTLGMWVLKYLIQKNKRFVELIDGERDYYSRISTDTDILITFLSLAACFPVIWNKLSESSKTIISSEIEKHDILNFLAVCVDENIQKHFEKLQGQPFYDESGMYNGRRRYSDIQNTHIELMLNLTDEDGEARDALCKFLIMIHTNSCSYDIADTTFEQVISPYILKFSKENIEFLLRGINSNGQCHERRENIRALREIRDGCVANNIQIDSGLYPNIPGISMFASE